MRINRFKIGHELHGFDRVEELTNYDSNLYDALSQISCLNIRIFKRTEDTNYVQFLKELTTVIDIVVLKTDLTINMNFVVLIHTME